VEVAKEVEAIVEPAKKVEATVEAAKEEEKSDINVADSSA